MQIHTKKRNRLDHQRLSDLVYIKYNRALRRRYDMCDTLDPILLDQIDESNEWLVGKLDENDNDEEGFVFDDESLQWGIVAEASGVGESRYNSRSISKGSTSKSTQKASKKKVSSSTPIQLIDEEEDVQILDDTDEEDYEDYKSEDNVENEEDNQFGDEY